MGLPLMFELNFFHDRIVQKQRQLVGKESSVQVD